MPKSDSQGFANRPAMADLVEKGWDTFVAAVEGLPHTAETEGVEEALAFGETHLRVMVDRLCLTWGRTRNAEKRQHELHIALTEGCLRPMLRRDRAGRNARKFFIRAVERVALSPSIKAAFERGRESDSDSEYVPDTGES